MDNSYKKEIRKSNISIILTFLIFIFIGAPIFFLSMIFLITVIIRMNNFLLSGTSFENIVPFLSAIEFPLFGLLIIFLIAIIYRKLLLLGSEKIIDIKQNKSTDFSKEILGNKLKTIFIEYSLKSPDRNWKQVLSGNPDNDVLEYIKSVYPEFNPKPKWKFGSTGHNFIETLALLEKVDIKEVNEKIPLFKESIRIIIKNLDNGKKVSQLLMPTQGPGFYNRPTLSVEKKDRPELFEGNNFEIKIAYKGTKGYSLKVFAK